MVLVTGLSNALEAGHKLVTIIVLAGHAGYRLRQYAHVSERQTTHGRFYYSRYSCPPRPRRKRGCSPPIYTSTTFGQPTDGTEGPFEYQRGGNPTRSNAEITLAALEGAEHAYVYATGMGATAAAMGILKAGQTIMLGMPVYGGNYRMATIEMPKRGVSYEFVHDFTALTDADFEGKDVGMIFLETPTNPTLRVIDIKAIAEIAHRNGALLVVDNTFMTPLPAAPPRTRCRYRRAVRHQVPKRSR